ncbi:MAG: family 43 glycosylhydrolase, partial [Novosphingobium sp.]
WGVRAYSSKDLYNWDDLGLIIPPDLSDPTSPLHPEQAHLDRPHILYNPRTKKFVCWIKLLDHAGRKYQTRSVLTADKITGPYTLVRKDIMPIGMSAGDFDLVVSPDDGKAYMYFERVHTEMICADLTDDYTDFTGYYTTHFPTLGPPLVREAPAYFRRRGKHYMTSSGATGYFPNPSEVAVAGTYHGPFTVLGDLHPSDKSRTSFNSQISGIFKHPKKKDLYIALADRWSGPLAGPDFESGRMSALIHNGLARHFGTPSMAVPPAAGAASVGMPASTPTSEARYVWLPIKFDAADRPTIEWREEWSLDEFA